MDCPKCEHDLSKFENYDNMHGFLLCPGCNEKLFLDYEEDCLEDYSECWDIWSWLTSEHETFKRYDKPDIKFIV
jgi:hypothetical protein